MNKRGVMLGGIFGTFILMLVLVNLIPIQEGLATKEDIISKLNWSNFNSSSTLQISDNNTEITNIVYKIVDAGVYVSFEVAKIGIEWGSENLHLKASTILLLLLLAIISPTLLVLIKFTIIAVIFIRDIMASRKEKKEIKRLKFIRDK